MTWFRLALVWGVTMGCSSKGPAIGDALPGGGTGDPCARNTECRSGICLSVGSKSVCSSPCGTNADCVPGWTCGAELGQPTNICECTPTAEVCDGRDNDCNGIVDDDAVVDAQCVARDGAGYTCGSGACSCATTCGAHYHYVAARILVPVTAQQRFQYGLDLDGNGSVDNQLGAMVVAFATQGFSAQTSTDEAVFGGNIDLLIDLQTTSFGSNTSNVGLNTFDGADAQPPACNAGEMVTCGSGGCTGCQHDLTGAGIFSLSPSSPDNSGVSGSFEGSTLVSQSGMLFLELSLFGGQPIPLNLFAARVNGDGITMNGITSLTIGGGLSTDEVDNVLAPAIASGVNARVQLDCPNAVPGSCSCDAEGTTLLGLFDSNHDCIVTASEVIFSAFGMTLLTPDVTIDAMPLLSVGVEVQGVDATYAVPGE